jgi:hypothetical protein
MGECKCCGHKRTVDNFEILEENDLRKNDGLFVLLEDFSVWM